MNCLRGKGKERNDERRRGIYPRRVLSAAKARMSSGFKSEANSKDRNPKHETQKVISRFVLSSLDFEFVSDFVLRISDFPPRHPGLRCAQDPAWVSTSSCLRRSAVRNRIAPAPTAAAPSASNTTSDRST